MDKENLHRLVHNATDEARLAYMRGEIYNAPVPGGIVFLMCSGRYFFVWDRPHRWVVVGEKSRHHFEQVVVDYIAANANR